MDAKTYDKLEELLRRVKAIEAEAGDMETDGLYRAEEALKEILYDENWAELPKAIDGLQQAAVELYMKEHSEFQELLQSLYEEQARRKRTICEGLLDIERALNRLCCLVSFPHVELRIQGCIVELSRNPGWAIGEAFAFLSKMEEEIKSIRFNLERSISTILKAGR